MIGQQVGNLEVIGWRQADNEYKPSLYICRCTCGQIREARKIDLVRRTVTSCGCSDVPVKERLPPMAERLKQPVTVEGVTKTVAEWLETTHLTFWQVMKRVDQGWTLERAVSVPLMKRGRPKKTATELKLVKGTENDQQGDPPAK